VLAETTAELNLRTLARLSGVSVAQMSRVLPDLVELGLVAGEDHDQVLGLLRQAGKDGAEVEVGLRRLLSLTTKAEYEPDDIAASVATKAVERAARCVAVARRVALAT
jgi:hypothetical protein